MSVDRSSLMSSGPRKASCSHACRSGIEAGLRDLLPERGHHQGGDVGEFLVPATGDSLKDGHRRIMTAPVLSHDDAGRDIDDGARTHRGFEVPAGIGRMSHPPPPGERESMAVTPNESLPTCRGLRSEDFAKPSKDLMLLSGPASGHWKPFSRSSHAPPSPGPCTGRPVSLICCHRRQRQFHHHQLPGSSPGHPACPRSPRAPFCHRESDAGALHRSEGVRAPHSSVLRTAVQNGRGRDCSTHRGRQRVHPA